MKFSWYYTSDYRSGWGNYLWPMTTVIKKHHCTFQIIHCILWLQGAIQNWTSRKQSDFQIRKPWFHNAYWLWITQLKVSCWIIISAFYFRFYIQLNKCMLQYHNCMFNMEIQQFELCPWWHSISFGHKTCFQSLHTKGSFEFLLKVKWIAYLIVWLTQQGDIPWSQMKSIPELQLRSSKLFRLS